MLVIVRVKGGGGGGKVRGGGRSQRGQKDGSKIERTLTGGVGGGYGSDAMEEVVG